MKLIRYNSELSRGCSRSQRRLPATDGSGEEQRTDRAKVSRAGQRGRVAESESWGVVIGAVVIEGDSENDIGIRTAECAYQTAAQDE